MHSRKIISIPVEGAVRPADGHGGRGECRTRTTETVPCELTETAQWMGWRGEQAGDDGKHKKVPVHPETGRKTNPHDPGVWRTYPEAVAPTEEHGLDGVGFVVTEEDDFCCVDVDDCGNPDTGEVAPWAMEIVELLDSYTEISPSGTGLKIWVRATKPGARCVGVGPWGRIEMYDRGPSRARGFSAGAAGLYFTPGERGRGSGGRQRRGPR